METANVIRRRTTDLEKQGAQARSKSQAILRVDQIYSRKTRQIHFVKTSKSASQAKYERYNKTTLVVRRIIEPKNGTVRATEVDIKSAGLKDILVKLFEDVEGLQLNKNPPVVDPQLLVHATKDLARILEEEKKKPDPSQSLINDISIALDFVAEDHGREIENLNTLSQHGEINYDLLWALFPPRTIIFTLDNAMHEPQALRFSSGSYEEVNGEKFYEIHGDILSHDGEELGYGPSVLKIKHFTGSKKVYLLSVHPLSAHPEADRLTEELVLRGRKFVSLIGPICVDYDGSGVTEDRARSDPREELFYSSGRLMCDPVSYRMRNPFNSLIISPYIHITKSEARLRDEDYLLASYRIQGFSFTHKKMGWICGVEDEKYHLE